MAEIDNIPEMRPSFDNIRRQDEGGNEYWSSRDLCAAMGYSAYWKFQRVIDKAIKVAGEKGMNVDDHFNQAVDMVRIGSGSFRKVNIFRLSRMACMIVAENANVKKVLVQQARDYFTRTISINELMQNSLSSNILLYKTAQGEALGKVAGDHVARLDVRHRLGTFQNGQPDIDRIAVEDARERIGDDQRNAARFDGDGRVLARGAAAEIVFRHHNVALFYVFNEFFIDIFHAVRGEFRLGSGV